jgi:hypothetical protein
MHAPEEVGRGSDHDEDDGEDDRRPGELDHQPESIRPSS